VDINAKNKIGETALHISIEYNSLGLANLLIDFGIDINANNFLLSQATALHIAIEARNSKLASLLVKRHTNVNVKDSRQQTPLHIAVENNSIAECALLIEYGAEINFKDSHGSTPLHIAAMNWRPTLVKLLLDSGASIDGMLEEPHSLAYIIEWYTPKDNHNELRRFLSVLKLLIDAGCDLNGVQYAMDKLEANIPTLRNMMSVSSNQQLKKKWSIALGSPSKYEAGDDDEVEVEDNDDDIDIHIDEVEYSPYQLIDDLVDGLKNNQIQVDSIHHKYGGIGFPSFKRLQLHETFIIDETEYQSSTAGTASFSQKLGTLHFENSFTTIIQSLLDCVSARIFTSANSFMLQLDGSFDTKMA
ncbi:hypothetical protein K450DRAFT_203250, partial [Umbelopsis ramanniana AG]